MIELVTANQWAVGIAPVISRVKIYRSTGDPGLDGTVELRINNQRPGNISLLGISYKNGSKKQQAKLKNCLVRVDNGAPVLGDDDVDTSIQTKGTFFFKIKDFDDEASYTIFATTSAGSCQYLVEAGG